MSRCLQNRLILLLVSLGVTGIAASAYIATTGNGGKETSLYLTVEKDGKLVEGLAPGNFRLYEDGEPRGFRITRPEKPAAVAVLLEYSQSSWPYWNDLESGLEAFLDKAPEGNWYALATYANSLQVRADFTREIGRIRQKVSDLGPPFRNEIESYDAISSMLEKMRLLKGRKVLIYVGSGLNTFGGNTLKDVKELAQSADVTIFCIGAGSAYRGQYQPYLSSMGEMTLLQAQSFLRMLAKQTGGEAWFPNIVSAIPDDMEGVMQILSLQYRMDYVSQIPNDGKFHRIKVEAFRIVNDHREDFDVRVRKGWRS